jgi:lysophospholipid acyltransferase (LPLAT)-like uncharacterized protein
MAKIRIKNTGKIIAWLMRAIGMTLRWDIRDNADVFNTSRACTIWAFWHNSMFLIPWLHREWFGHIPGTVLTSPSGDGQIIADICASFGIEAARGSSSKPEKGMSALIALAEKARQGYDIGITPDGPRGPQHRVQPGVVKLAQLTGVPLIPVNISYSRCIKFKTWDQFMIPLPFAKVTMTFHPALVIPRRMTEEAFEEKRAALEETLRAGTDLEKFRDAR